MTKICSPDSSSLIETTFGKEQRLKESEITPSPFLNDYALMMKQKWMAQRKDEPEEEDEQEGNNNPENNTQETDDENLREISDASVVADTTSTMAAFSSSPPSSSSVAVVESREQLSGFSEQRSPYYSAAKTTTESIQREHVVQEQEQQVLPLEQHEVIKSEEAAGQGDILAESYVDCMMPANNDVIWYQQQAAARHSRTNSMKNKLKKWFNGLKI